MMSCLTRLRSGACFWPWPCAGDPTVSLKVLSSLMETENGLIDAVFSLYMMIKSFLKYGHESHYLVWALYCNSVSEFRAVL